ncbi:MAG: hypothetical protein PF450_13865, partial [Bacteroidales bacterium]|nr:hypothetical protein [Bacteroidales bacterium]
SSALIDEDNRYYVLIKIEENDKEFIFRKVPLKTGTIQKEIAEVLEEDLNNVLVKGIYDLY